MLQILLTLSRAASLPTVWSNCLAGWWLGGGGNYWKLPFLLLGVSVLQTGGMFLNDAFDQDYDRRQRPDRPIPAGKISASLVWQLGFGQLVAGIFLLVFCSQISAGAAIVLSLFILLYNFSHKFFTAAPWLLAVCRLWIYVIAGAAGKTGLNGWVIYSGVALAFYVAGTHYVIRRETFRAVIPHWPLLLLALPIALALLMNSGHFRWPAIGVSVLLTLWVAFGVKAVIINGQANSGWIASILFAGIVLVDWLAVVPQIPWWIGFLIFPVLFGAALWLPRLLLAPSPSRRWPA